MSKFLNNIDLNGNELRNIKLQNLAVAPTTSAAAGGLYYDTASNVVKFHNGTSWVTISAGSSGTWQPYDADLTAISALTGTAGFLKTNGSGTWSVDTNTYLTAATGVTSVNGSSGALANVALTTVTLAQFAATTSAQLAGVLSDETGFSTGAKSVFNISPTITTSLITDSSTFALVNTVATTVNFAGAATTLSIGSASGTTTINNNTVITGNLTVNGTTTTVNSTTITVDDILMELGAVTTPTDITAEGGGLKLFGTTNKTITWVGTYGAWTSSENFDLVTGKTYKINGTNVLSSTTLGSGVTGSSLTSVGTITTGIWNGTTIAVLNGGTGATTAAGAKTNLGFTTKYAADIGDGTATSITVSHGLASSDVQVYVYEKATPFGQVFPDVAHTSSSVVTLSFASAPTAAQYRVVVIG